MNEIKDMQDQAAALLKVWGKDPVHWKSDIKLIAGAIQLGNTFLIKIAEDQERIIDLLERIEAKLGDDR